MSPESPDSIQRRVPRFPVHGYAGVLLVAVFWWLNWTTPGLRTQWMFFPLWLGYCLTVDGLLYWRKGTSMLTRSPGAYFALFLVSAPAWWLFELINLRTQNWVYMGREFFTNLQYGLLASLSFSTVMPAVFGTAELVGTIPRLRCTQGGPRFLTTRGSLAAVFGFGLLALSILLVWPRYFYPLVWLSVFCIVDPINLLLGNRSLVEYVRAGDWRPVVSLALGALVCGFFWEMWNFHCYPKWTYTTPMVQFLHVFEMPVLGYIGYIPFSWELFALYQLVWGAVTRHGLRESPIRV